MTLSEWLLVQIAEDVAVDPEHGHLLNVEHHDPQCDLLTALSDYNPHCDCAGPTRWKAECEAKRRIVASHSNPGSPDDDCYWAYMGGLLDVDACPTLRALALPYADRPGYREEWRP